MIKLDNSKEFPHLSGNDENVKILPNGEKWEMQEEAA